MTEYKDPAPDCPEELFEEQFPNLIQDDTVIHTERFKVKGIELPKSVLQEHCLSKEKVREAIDRRILKLQRIKEDTTNKINFNLAHNEMIGMKELKKELGLK